MFFSCFSFSQFGRLLALNLVFMKSFCVIASEPCKLRSPSSLLFSEKGFFSCASNFIAAQAFPSVGWRIDMTGARFFRVLLLAEFWGL